MVVNLSYSFIPLQKVSQKGVDHSVENPQERAENIKMAPNAPSAEQIFLAPPPTPPTSDTAAKWVRMLGGFRASAFERLSRSDLWFQRGWRLPTNKQNAVLHFLGLMLIWSDRKIF